MISFLEVRQDRQGFGILIWKHVGTQKISTRSSKLGVSCRLPYASPNDRHAITCFQPQTGRGVACDVTGNSIAPGNVEFPGLDFPSQRKLAKVVLFYLKAKVEVRFTIIGTDEQTNLQRLWIPQTTYRQASSTLTNASLHTQAPTGRKFTPNLKLSYRHRSKHASLRWA